MSYWTCNNCSKRFNQNPNSRECCGVKRMVSETRVIKYYEKFYSDKNKTLNEVRSEILKNDFVYDKMTCYCTKYTVIGDNWSNINPYNLVKSVTVNNQYGSTTMSGECLVAYNEMFGLQKKEEENVHYCDFPAKAMIESCKVKMGGDTVSKWKNEDELHQPIFKMK